MKEEYFVEMLKDAAKDAAVSLRQVEVRQQAPDHPILWNVPETNYLKFYIFQIVWYCESVKNIIGNFSCNEVLDCVKST